MYIETVSNFSVVLWIKWENEVQDIFFTLEEVADQNETQYDQAKKTL